VICEQADRQTSCYHRGLGSRMALLFVSVRSNAHRAKAMLKVSIASGSRIRVIGRARCRWTYTGRHKIPRLPNAQRPKAAVTQQRAIADPATGMRADPSCTPKAL
jgi:hypothetical protein